MLLSIMVLSGCRSEAASLRETGPSGSAARATHAAAPASAAKLVFPSQSRPQPGSLEHTLLERRSVRRFSSAPLTLEQLGALAWAAQGTVDRDWGRRTTPSAGGLYPLELYLVLPLGFYRYDTQGHAMLRLRADDLRPKLHAAALDQLAVRDAPAVFVLTAVPERTRVKYQERTERYVAMEAGHAAQNLLLTATALSLGAVPIGAFDDRAVARVLGLPEGEEPLYLLPVGNPERR